MSSKLERYKKDLDYLLKLGDDMLVDLELQRRELEGEKLKDIKHKPGSIFFTKYQNWYSEAHSVIKQILPDRLDEFEKLYKGEGKRKQINSITYTIQDWFNGVRSGINQFNEKKYFDDFGIALMKFQTQHTILGSAKLRFESSLFEIEQLLQADLFDSELTTAQELAGKGFLRSAGAVAGVVLEKHLGKVCKSHNVQSVKKNSTINDFNDLLKKDNIYDVGVWRPIQRLADLRNLCDHDKQKEPTEDEVEELIKGVDKIIKTIF